ncbi:MAG: type II toxin-antitoxin system PemK/MazF family toxin [Alphaproteobacteria bacterium]|nr:type II toxin-antitoxin system PemK/MazF family toxin [Alphaproteobacteria bacterium]
MPTFRQGDVVRVPFPYTDRNTRQHRPALVVSHAAIGEADPLLWVVMITSAANRRWLGDVSLETGHVEAGLPVPSIIRPAKIATIDASSADRLGSIPATRLTEVMAQIIHVLGSPEPG